MVVKGKQGRGGTVGQWDPVGVVRHGRPDLGSTAAARHCRCGCGSGAVTRKHVLCRWAGGCLTTPAVQDAGGRLGRLASQLMRASHDEDEQKQQSFRPRQGDGFP